MKTTNHRLFALLALPLAISACSTIPKPATTMVAQPNLAVDQAYQVLDADTISAAEAPSMASMRWQDFYADAKLKSLIEIGLNNNKDLQKAVLAIQSARAQYQITSADAVPKLGASGGASRSANQMDRNASTGYNVGLGMSSYELDLWGKVANAKDAALHNYLATNAAKDTVQISLISGIAQSYVNLSYALAQRQLAIETIKTREHSLDITNKRFAAGIDARSPSLQAEASLEAAKLAIYQADTGILQARNALQLLLGAPIPDELMPDMAVDNITTQTLFSTGLPSELLYYRPDIVQAEHALKAAGANINVARAAYFPSISLSGNLGFSSSSLSNLLQSSAFAWSAGPAINLPIFDAGMRRANYEAAQVAQQSALVSYEKAIQTAFKEVGDVLASRATLGRQLESQYKLQQNYQQTYQIAHARFRSGLDNYLSVLDAERSLFGNQQSILNLELQKILSQIELYQVLGGGATLTAEQIADIDKQRAAMRTAALASSEQVQPAEPSAPALEVVQPAPANVNVIEPANQNGILVQ
ncbi:efflux transporter outer membrane subunit [Moraxella nasibovis]|uniref:efflux transporter outer membrane subunit n=1 Tax=Moraxella nasibovis TaxID=2904120 RepID=UPI00240FF745|nr:efflux transporter outer membrane subunit [Moraxella nasibovis]WFF37879.1 efflux transporter outer membrane subunit [Moraxella nasibovis]